VVYMFCSARLSRAVTVDKAAVDKATVDKAMEVRKVLWREQ
jgi:hypothetical protein